MESWLLSANRYCGPCFSTGRGFTKGNKPTYLRELQNQPRGELMATQAMAAAGAAAGWRGLNQFGLTAAIPVAKQENGVHLYNTQYTFVLQHIAHYLPIAMATSRTGHRV